MKQARERAGISQRRLGILMDLEPMSASIRMNRYERGARNPSFQTAVKIAEILEVPPSFFYEPRDVLAEVILVWGQKEEAELEEMVSGSGS